MLTPTASRDTTIHPECTPVTSSGQGEAGVAQAGAQVGQPDVEQLPVAVPYFDAAGRGSLSYRWQVLVEGDLVRQLAALLQSEQVVEAEAQGLHLLEEHGGFRGAHLL